MGLYYVFRVQGTKDEGMRIPLGLYTAIISTAENLARGGFPILLAHNKYDNRFINEDQIEPFKKELDGVGTIVLTNPLIQYLEDNEGNRTELLENIFTPTRAAIALATAMDLCDICLKRSKSIKINLEDANPDHYRLSLEEKLNHREYSWMYPVEATSLTDYVTRNNNSNHR
jgi:hypothetical protein